MARSHRSELPPLGLGLASIVLGAMGLALFFLPVLGLPVGGAGLALGCGGVVAALVFKSLDLRLSLAGIAICILAIGVDAAMTYAPSGFPSNQGGLPNLPLLPANQTRFVPPPAPFRGEAGGWLR